jgi:hypothetical protein
VAQAIQFNLDSVCEVKLWTQGSFRLTQGTLESLVTAVAESDFAVLVLTTDDLNISRGEAKLVARDNVLFELGLFIGALGRDRTFIVYDHTDPPELPSDLAGVTAATFTPHSDGNLKAALGAPCSRIQDVIERLRDRQGKGSQNYKRGTQDPAAGFFAPPDGGEVGQQETVTGRVTGLSPGTEAWILVQPLVDAHYWPQHGLPTDQSNFQEVAHFGRIGTQDIGKKFLLLLIMASSDASALFQEFRDKDSSRGLPELPPDVEILAQVTVTRR